jgi:hypothetical protein
MAAAGMQNGRSHSRSQMRIDTSCDVAKLAVTLARRRVLEPERRFNPFTPDDDEVKKKRLPIPNDTPLNIQHECRKICLEIVGCCFADCAKVYLA